jgi:FAD/FMN-containing dehydrogenase
MTMTATYQSSTTKLDRTAVEELAGQLAGNLLEPGSAEFEEARSIWNGMIDMQPALIVQPTGIADIQLALAFAQSHGLEISIRCGGHNVAGYALTNGGLMLDLSLMRGVMVDPVARTARVQGGATWADFDRETGVFGLATTGGVISTTGVAGLTLGGGVGWLVGKHGMSIDNLLSVELVTADGKVLRASEFENPDLFWALRGGGGNFGVVTQLEFKLYPQEMVLAGMVAYPPGAAAEVLRFFREFTASAPDELILYLSLMAEPESGSRIIGMAIAWTGDLAEGERVLQPLLAFGEPVLQQVGPMPYPVWQSMNDILFPHGRHYYWKGAMVEELPDEMLDTMVDAAAFPELPWLNATIEYYGGAMNRVDPTATAFPHRHAKYQVLAIGACDDSADDERAKQWARDLHARVVATTSSAGNNLNFSSPEKRGTRERIAAGFGANWERLQAIKRTYDPMNVFHRNNTIAT